jgi:ABC-2 type transport system ATP-binding protein
MSIRVENINKWYGDNRALNEVTFSIEKGSIVGFLGPNGAGKSTLMKILTTYIKPSNGRGYVNGYSISEQKKDVRKCIGYLPEHNPLYLDMYVTEYLEFVSNVHRVSKDRIKKVIQQTGLTIECNKKIEQLSKGYRQRVGLASTLLHDPEVLILDEPTTGLDPNQIIEIRELIRSVVKESNKTVLLSTHIMQEVEALCDHVLIIDKGNIVHDKSLEETLKENDLESLFSEITTQK